VTKWQSIVSEGPPARLRVVEDLRIGAALRSVRRRKGWSQATLATKARVSQARVSRMERGHLGSMRLDDIRRVAAALDIRIDVFARWRAGDLDRLLNARHSELHELVARWFAAELPDWVLAQEVSFAIYGERGVIDILAWHEPTRSLLVIELKTAITDVNELLGTADRKRRLAAQVGSDRGWDPLTVSRWLIVADTRTNRRRLDAHMAVIRNAFPDGTWAIRRWLRRPGKAIAAMTVWATRS
jgi:transcriptional regulator with XRE-family HTH domain